MAAMPHLVKMNGTGKFAFADGRTFDYALDKLSEDDQKVITEKTAAPASE